MLLEGSQRSVTPYENDLTLFEYYEKHVASRLGEAEAAVDDAPAIFFKDKTITQRQFYATIVTINNFLYNKLQLDKEGEGGGGGGADSDQDTRTIIGVHLNPDEYTIAMLLAISSLSFSYLPIDPQLPIERMKYMIADARPALIISNGATADDDAKLQQILDDLAVSPPTPSTQLISQEEILASSSSFSLSTNIKKRGGNKPNPNACVLYTSGSTGMPKGVLLSNVGVMNRLNWQWEQFELGAGDVGAFKTSLNFVDHICEVFSFVLRSLPIAVIEPSALSASLGDLFDVLFERRISYFILVPSLLKNMLLYAKSNRLYVKLTHVRNWICSGEPLTLDLLDAFFDMVDHVESNSVDDDATTTTTMANSKAMKISNFYGSTEVTADITFATFESRAQLAAALYETSNVPIGAPIANCRVYLLDEAGTLVGGDERIGEIYAGGCCLANGYLNDSQVSTNKFVMWTDAESGTSERLFKTGDFGLVHNATLYYMGRQDSQVKIGGKRVDLNELQYHATKLDSIASFVPIIFEYNTSEKFIVAFYTTTTTTTTTTTSSGKKNNPRLVLIVFLLLSIT